MGRTIFAFAAMLLLAVPAHAGFIGITWNTNPEPDIAGYVLFSGTVSGTYTNSVDVGNTTTWHGTALTDGQQYFFALLAYNADGVNSALSEEISAKPFSTAALSAPVPGAALTTASTFQWSVGNGVSQYRLTVGTTFGGSGVFDQTSSSTAATVSGLPASGTIFVRLWSLMGATWHFTDYTYSAAAPAPAASITYPANKAINADMAQAIQWTTVTGAQAYYLYVGSTLGAKDLVNTGEIQGTSYRAMGLPGSQTVFARLYTKIGGAWRFTDITFSAAASAPAVALLTSPLNGAVNVDSTLPMQWTTAATAQAYYLYVGSTFGTDNLVNSGETLQTSYLATGLPTGQTLFARLWTKAGGTWRFTDSTFSAAASAPVVAVLTSPFNGATSVDPTVPMRWTTVANAQAYYLYVGSTVGAKNLTDSHEIQQTSFLSAGLPAGQTVFVRLWTKVGGVWRFVDTTFKVR